MSKIQKSISANLLSIIGWLNIVIWYFIIENFFYMKLDLIKDGSVIDSIHLFLMFSTMLNLALIGLSFFSFIFEYIFSAFYFTNLPFNLPIEKINNKLIYKIFFYGGWIFAFLPLFFPFILASIPYAFSKLLCKLVSNNNL